MTQIETGGARSIRVGLPLNRSGFGLGTGILTTDGELPVEFLEPGDRIVTYDRGAVRLARVIQRIVAANTMVQVRPPVLDPAAGARDFLVSARQKILLTDWRAMALLGKRAGLVEAGRLVDGTYMTRLTGTAPTRLFQLVFDDARHALQLAGGTMLAASDRPPVSARR